MKSPNRIIQLDILRIVAVLLVLGRHAAPFPADGPRLVGSVFDAWNHIGWIGVDLFFVLSGFLVSGVLFKEYAAHGSIKLKRFFIRRGLKIYPAFYLMILVTVVWRVVTGNGVDFRKLLAELFFIQNYIPGFWEHTWSLAVEEHFYLLLPVLLIFLSRRDKSDNPFRALPAIFVLIACAGIVLRLATSYTLEYEFRTHLYPTHLRLGSLFFGVLLSYYRHFEPAKLEFFKKRPLLIPVGSAACITPIFLLPVDSLFVHTLGLTLLYVGFGALLMLSLYWKPFVAGSNSKVALFLAYLGAHSYSIYLWHIPVLYFGLIPLREIAGFQLPYIVEWSLYIAGSIGVGLAMAKIVEFPILKLRDRLFPSRSDQPALSQAASGLGMRVDN